MCTFLGVWLSCLLIEVFTFAWKIRVVFGPSSFVVDASRACPFWCFYMWIFAFSWYSCVCRASYLLWLPLHAIQLSYGVGMRCGAVWSVGVLSGGGCRLRLPLPLPLRGGCSLGCAACRKLSGKSLVSVDIVGYAWMCSVIDCDSIDSIVAFHIPSGRVNCGVWPVFVCSTFARIWSDVVSASNSEL